MNIIKCLLPAILLFSSFELAQAAARCSSQWSKAFDRADSELFANLDLMQSNNSLSATDVSQHLPLILRTHRCHLKWICHVAEHQDASKQAKVLIPGCNPTTIFKVEQRFASELFNETENENESPFSGCVLSGKNDDKEKLFRLCAAHVDFKLEQIKSFLPLLLKQEAQRKEDGFLAFKLWSLTERLKALQDHLLEVKNTFVQIISKISCVAPQCSQN